MDCARLDWPPKERKELRIAYDPDQKQLYENGDPTCQYWPARWNPVPISPERQQTLVKAHRGPDYWKHVFGGRASHGEFPVVLVREYFRWLGYTVWASEPRLVRPDTNPPQPEGYVLLSFPGARDPTHRHHENYRVMAEIFGDAALKGINKVADEEKRMLKHNRGGGDPDLFVFKKDGKKDRFFVEVKEKDELLPVQKLCFCLIEQYLNCDVRTCRIFPIIRGHH